MAISRQEAARRRKANLSRDDIVRDNPRWSDIQVQDYLDKQEDIDSLSKSSDTIQEQVDQNTKTNELQQAQINSNTAGVNNNASNVAQNAINIANNALNIAQNSLDITAVTNSFNSHNDSDSQHGVTGVNVGTEDFAQSSIGGTVLLADLTNDAVDSTVSVVSPDAPLAAAIYSQSDTQANIDLTNELKTNVNQLVIDLNAAIAQINDALDKSKTAKQMSTT